MHHNNIFSFILCVRSAKLEPSFMPRPVKIANSTSRTNPGEIVILQLYIYIYKLFENLFSATKFCFNFS